MCQFSLSASLPSSVASLTAHTHSSCVVHDVSYQTTSVAAAAACPPCASFRFFRMAGGISRSSSGVAYASSLTSEDGSMRAPPFRPTFRSAARSTGPISGSPGRRLGVSIAERFAAASCQCCCQSLFQLRGSPSQKYTPPNAAVLIACGLIVHGTEQGEGQRLVMSMMIRSSNRKPAKAVRGMVAPQSSGVAYLSAGPDHTSLRPCQDHQLRNILCRVTSREARVNRCVEICLQGHSLA